MSTPTTELETNPSVISHRLLIAAVENPDDWPAMVGDTLRALCEAGDLVAFFAILGFMTQTLATCLTAGYGGRAEAMDGLKASLAQEILNEKGQ